MTTSPSNAAPTCCADCGKPDAYGFFRRGPLCPRCAGKMTRAGHRATRILRDWTIRDAIAFRASRVLAVDHIEDDGEIVATVETIGRGFAWWTTTIFAADFPSIHGRQISTETKTRAEAAHAGLGAIAYAVAVGQENAAPLLARLKKAQA